MDNRAASRFAGELVRDCTRFGPGESVPRQGCSAGNWQLPEGRISYRGQGFSLQREKGRFVLPAPIRKTIKQSGDKLVVCLVRHNRWNCLTGFGLSRVDELEDELDRDERIALGAGQPFDRELRSAQVYGFSEVPFDESGRFVMPNHLIASAKLGAELFFHGIGKSFLIWNPAELAKMGEGWEGLQAACDDELARARGGKA
jgi:MraZ protein